MKIYKYTIEAADSFTVDMPSGAQVLSVGVQHGQPRLWALVNPKNDLTPHRFYVRGTGHDAHGMDTELFVGTFQMDGGVLVFHVFEDVTYD